MIEKVKALRLEKDTIHTAAYLNGHNDAINKVLQILGEAK